MSSTTEQRMALEDAVTACLDEGDDPDEIVEAVESAIESWKADQ